MSTVTMSGKRHGDQATASADDSSGVGRRQLLKSLPVGSTAIAAGLAGCQDQSSGSTDTPTSGNGDDDDESTDTTASGGTPIDDTYTVGTSTTPRDPAFNRFNVTKDHGNVAGILFGQGMKYIVSDGEWAPELVKDYSVDGSTITFTVDDRYTWHNGEDVVAEDILTHYRLINHTTDGGGPWNYVESMSAPDKYTWEVEMSDSYNQNVVFIALFFQEPIASPRFVFGEYLSDLEAAETDSEQQSALKNLTDFRWQEPVGWGPFQFSEVSGQTVILEKYEDHPYADDINFSQWEFQYFSKSQQRVSAGINDKLDGDVIWSPDKKKLAEQKGADNWEFMAWQKDGGGCPSFGMDSDLWSDRNARKGFLYLLNVKEMADAAFDDVVYNEHPSTLMPKSGWDRYLSDITLEDYGWNTQKKEKAKTHFEKAGWSKQNGEWVDENGEVIEITTTVGSAFTPWKNEISIYNQMFEDFGFNTRMKTVEGTSYWSGVANGEYDLFFYAWNQPKVPTAYSTYNSTFNDAQDFMRVPDELEIPEYGDVGGENAITVKPKEKLQQLATASSQEEVKKYAQQLAWIANQTVPQVADFSAKFYTPVTTDAWEYPSGDDTVWSTRRPLQWLPRSGQMSAKTE